MIPLKEYRESKGVKQIAVADHLGITRQTYSSYEKAPENMSIDQAKAVCDFLGCNVADIFLQSGVSDTNIADKEYHLATNEEGVS